MGGRKFRALRGAFLAGVASVAIIASAAQAQTTSIDVPEQPLSQSLKAIAGQTGTNILFTPDAVEGIRAHALQGTMSAQQAVSELIAGSALEVVPDGNGGLIVRRKETAKPQLHAEGDETDTVVVTGTRIVGEGPVGSKVHVYTRTDLDQSGAGTLDQFARQIPENLSNTDGIANVFSGAQGAAHPGGDSNNNAAAAFNIGGLGANATLTLLDGHRVAASGDLGSFVDVSMIPFAAIDRIEVLTDGASSVYGSDAIGGVVNIIMKKNFDGAESSLRYGGATDGGADEFTASQLLGTSWTGGNALLNVEYDNQGGLDASQRKYIPSQGGPKSLLPKSHRITVFFNGSQDIDDSTTVSAEAIYTHKNVFLDATISSLIEDVATTQPGAISQLGGTLSIDHRLSDDWQVSLTGNYSLIDQSFDQTAVVSIPGFPAFTTTYAGHTPTTTGTAGVDAVANGTLWTLPAGDIKTALGASYRSENYHTTTYFKTNGVPTNYLYPHYSRSTESVYGEVFVPLVGDANAMPFVRRLDVSGAVRFDNYSDFGSTTNPKVGVEWSPLDELGLRATWGTSYRAPLLTQLDVPLTYTAEFVPHPGAPGGATDILDVSGGNRNLKPETATVISAGADWQPLWIPGLKLSLTYSYVRYKNLIGIPPVTNFGNIFADPTLTPFINLSPSPAYVQAAFNSFGFTNNSGLGPSFVQAVFNEQDTNLAGETESNIDLRASYVIPSDAIPDDYGQYLLSAAVDHFDQDSLQSAPTSPAIEILNTYGEPLRWKVRGGVSWVLEDFTATLNLNYANNYTDNLTIPAGKIASWTTEDLYLAYSLDHIAALEGFKLSLSVQNITDQKPPYVVFPAANLLPGQNPEPIDPVNASPIGRFIAVQVVKSF